jgi:ABC transport system ATP-binding/permease protein
MRVSHLAQEPEFPAGATPSSELTVAQQPLRDALDEYAKLSAALETNSDERVLERLSKLVETIEHLGGWDTAHESSSPRFLLSSSSPFQ